VIALASSGLHANGFSLVRQVLAETGADLSAPGPGGGGRTLGEDLLEPTKIYALDCLRLIATGGVHAFAHVTGGGLAGNLVRVLPAGLCASIDRSTWQLPAVFRWLAERGGLGRADMERTFNMGIGMVAVLEAARAAQAVRDLEAAGIGAWVAGVIEETVTGPAVTLSGEQGTRT
jgi:phosphoribosylformylglycinamidine cyclo-ligase